MAAFSALAPNAQALGTDQFPAPAAQTWAAVAIALDQGLSSLENVKLWLIFAGGVVGLALTIAPVLLPKYKEHLPSASAFGLAWVFNWHYGFLFFLGALVSLFIERRSPKIAKEFTLPVASGVLFGNRLFARCLKSPSPVRIRVAQPEHPKVTDVFWPPRAFAGKARYFRGIFGRPDASVPDQRPKKSEVLARKGQKVSRGLF